MAEMLSPTPSMLKCQGDAMFSDGSISDAIKLWNDALNVSRTMSATPQPDNTDLRHVLHMSIVKGYTRRGEWDKVLAHCEAAIAEGSKDTKALRWRAIALGRLSRTQEAACARQNYEAETGCGDAQLAAFTRRECERQKAKERGTSEGLRQFTAKLQIVQEPATTRAATCPFLLKDRGHIEGKEDSIDGLRQRMATPPALEAPSDAGGATCPFLGKKGICPVTKLVDSCVSKVDSTAPAPVDTRRRLMGGSGKNLTSAYVGGAEKNTATRKAWWLRKEGLLYQLCPLNWNYEMMKLLVLVSLISWLNGAVCGWWLART